MSMIGLQFLWPPPPFHFPSTKVFVFLLIGSTLAYAGLYLGDYLFWGKNNHKRATYLGNAKDSKSKKILVSLIRIALLLIVTIVLGWLTGNLDSWEHW